MLLEKTAIITETREVGLPYFAKDVVLPKYYMVNTDESVVEIWDGDLSKSIGFAYPNNRFVKTQISSAIEISEEEFNQVAARVIGGMDDCISKLSD